MNSLGVLNVARGAFGEVGDFFRRGEVDFAQKNNVELFVLHSVEVTLRGKRYVARGGVVRVVNPWRPQRGQLQPIAFTCSF